MMDEARRQFFDAIVAHDHDRVASILASQPELLSASAPEELAPEGLGGCTALHLAALLGDAELERMLVGAGADLEARNAEGRTPLHVALEYNNTTREQLLELGAEVDASAAAALSMTDRLAQLLDADPARVDDVTTQITPMCWAAFFGTLDAARLLLDRGANPDDGALCCAAMVSGVEMGRLLLDAGADPDAIPEGWDGNALHFAASQRYTEDGTPFVELLLEAGADPHLENGVGWTARQVAEHWSARSDDERKRASYDRIATLLS